jgi:hypothetical protein
MITSIKEYFSKFIEPGTRPDAAGGAHALQVATAALLLEMMRMDARLTAAEHDAIAATLRREFGLSADELATLVALADLLHVGHADYVAAKQRGWTAGRVSLGVDAVRHWRNGAASMQRGWRSAPPAPCAA